MTTDKRFESILYAVSPRVKEVLLKLSPTVKSNTSEIRLRTGLPLALTVASETVFVRQNGQTQFFLSNDLFKISKPDLEESFKNLCNNSVFAHENELQNGFIIMKNGCRAGVGGNINEKGSFKDISSIIFVLAVK